MVLEMNTEIEYQTFTEYIDKLKKENPGWQISFGYIGNVWYSPYSDDRSWKIWMRPEGIMESWEYQDSYHVEVHDSIVIFSYENFEKWINNQKKRWADYMQVNHKNKMIGKTEKEVFLNMMERMGYVGKSRCYSDETYFYCLTRRNSYGDEDKYTYAKLEAAFDSLGNLVEIRAAS